MKYLFTILILIPLFAVGQSSPEGEMNKRSKNNFEFGISLYSLTIQPDFEYNNGYDDMLNSKFIPGLVLKKHLGKNAFRFSFNYDHKNVAIEERGDVYYYKANGTFHSIDIKLGYERALTQKRLAPYLFADLNYYKSQSTGKFTAIGCFTVIYDMKYDFVCQEYALLAGTGLRFHLAKKIVLHYELSFHAGYTYYQSFNEGYYNRPFYKRFLRINPVKSLGISYVF